MNQEQIFKSKINQVINLNLNNPNLKGDYIAQELGVNRMYLHRKLKMYYNMNARDYIQKIRIDFAKMELKNSKIPINVIAKQVGYEDISYFSKVFKKVTGIPPSGYRR